jgi:hypothetical protein
VTRSTSVCAVEPVRAGVESCELLRIGQRSLLADGDGVLSFSFVVHRRIEPTGAGSAVDCGETGCALVIVDNRYRTVVPLAFDADEPAPPEATADVALPAPLAAGDRAEVTVTDVRPGQFVRVLVSPREIPFELMMRWGDELADERVGDDGVARLRVRVPGRTVSFPVDGPINGVPVDCTARPGRCELVVTTLYRVIERVPLDFG